MVSYLLVTTHILASKLLRVSWGYISIIFIPIAKVYRDIILPPPPPTSPLLPFACNDTTIMTNFDKWSVETFHSA